ncbi:hypothetical protein CBR_g21775 [Chara braunii]|uniref:Reverse transcriptase domain-containing protein n=1 Tax=Chara braunii TaxID=69332 RepID=A0A388JUH4_CHABU|nr:hypothetical protein CBR_g21775 [Chara braunii]|eukprot:GBG61430.1 hypothetical protein CBR_g21775 [Chara braunii]
MADANGIERGPGATPEDFVKALEKREMARLQVPKVNIFHFNGDRVSEWLELLEQVISEALEADKFKLMPRYVWRELRPEVVKVAADANGEWAKFKEEMQRRFKLGDGLLTKEDLEMLRRDEFSTVGAFATTFEKMAKKVPGLAEEEQCVTFLEHFKNWEGSSLTKKAAPGKKLAWAAIKEGVMDEELDQVDIFQMRQARKKRKALDATTSDGCDFKKMVEDAVAQLHAAKDARRKTMAAPQTIGIAKKAVVQEEEEEEEKKEPEPQKLTKAQRKARNSAQGGQGSGRGQVPQAVAMPPPESSGEKKVVEPPVNEEEEDDCLRNEEDEKAEQKAKKRGVKADTEKAPEQKNKKYTVRVEEKFDVEEIMGRILEGHNHLMNLKDVLASAPKLREELKARLCRKMVASVRLGAIILKEAEWSETGTKMDRKSVACGCFDVVVKGKACTAMVDTGTKMNLIKEEDAVRLGMEIDRSDNGILVGANSQSIFVGTASKVVLEIRKWWNKWELKNLRGGLKQGSQRRYKRVDQKCRPVPVLIAEEKEVYYERERELIRQMREDAANMPSRINPEIEKALIIGEPGFLTAQEEKLMVETIRGRHTAYAFNDDERGRLDVDKILMIRIHTVPHEPWNLRGARYPNPGDEEKIVDYLDGKIRTHVADYSSGPYASPWFCFIKPNRTLRWVQDLQRLNAVTVRDAGGLPNADALSEACAGRAIISLIDLYSGYDQFPVYLSDRPMMAMHTPRGLIHMNVAPQGWTNAVAMVQRHMMRAMQPVSPHITQPYIDDLAVKGSKVKDEQEVMPGIKRFVWDHVQDLCQVLDLLQEHNLTASGPKSKHCMRGATILGFVCDEKGRRPDTKKTNKILEWPIPFETITEVRSFLGTCGFWIIFIKGFATKTEHLRKLVHQGQDWEWGDRQESVIKDLKKEFEEGGLVLGVPDHAAVITRPFIIETDAGPTALGEVLIQKDLNGEERPLRFESRTLNTAERNYSQFKRETLAVLHCLRIFRNYLFGSRHATFPIESFLKTWRRQDLESELTFEELLDLRARQIGAIEDRIEGAASKVAYNRAHDKFRWDKMARVRKESLRMGDTMLLRLLRSYYTPARQAEERKSMEKKRKEPEAEGRRTFERGASSTSQEGERRREHASHRMERGEELPAKRNQERRELEVSEAPPQSIQRPEDQAMTETRPEAPCELTGQRMDEDQAARQKELDRQERATREQEIRAEVMRKNLKELHRKVEQGERPVNLKDRKGKSVSSQQEEDPPLLSEAWENFDRLMGAARGPEGPQQEMGVKLVFADLLILKGVMKEGFAAARASDQKIGERLTKVAQKAYSQGVEWEKEDKELKKNQERQDRELDAMKPQNMHMQGKTKSEEFEWQMPSTVTLLQVRRGLDVTHQAEVVRDEGAPPIDRMVAEGQMIQGSKVEAEQGIGQETCQDSTMPQGMPLVANLEEALGLWATGSGSAVRASGPARQTEESAACPTPSETPQQEVTSEVTAVPSSILSQEEEKTTRKKSGKCFYCKKGKHFSDDCPKFYEDEARGFVTRVSTGIWRDRNGNLVERSCDGGRMQLCGQIGEGMID